MKQEDQYPSVQVYLENQSEEARERLLELKSCILSVVPDAVEMINYNIPAYALVEGGKRDQQIMMAGYKKHVGLYPHPSTMEHFWDQLDDYKRAKGSVQFPLSKPLPKELVVEMVRYRKSLIDKEQNNTH